MGRPIFSYELDDPDFSWLISTFQESHPNYCFFETSSLPIVFIPDMELAGGERVHLPEEIHENDLLDVLEK